MDFTASQIMLLRVATLCALHLLYSMQSYGKSMHIAGMITRYN